jgi:acetyl-CoA acetyltransferase
MTKQSAAVVVGVGNTNYGSLYYDRNPERSDYDLAVQSFRAAVEDSGIDKNSIDAVLCMRIPSYVTFCDRVGLRHLRHTNYYEGDGRMSGLIIQHAVALIESGQATTVACVYGNNGRSVAAKYGGEPRPNSPAEFDQMYGMTSPGAYVGMMYRRYRHLYGAPEDALAPLAINNRKNGALNTDAVMQKPITYEEYVGARYVAEPLRLYDYCLINDGGVTVIVTTAERAKDLKKPAVHIKGTATSTDLTNFYTSKDFFFEACQMAATELYEKSGLSPKDADCAQIYDNFTPTILFTLEGFNYAKRGEAWQFIRDGRIELGGDLPVNTSGGHTAESYMQGWGHIVEAVRQVRGEAGKRQVPDCKVSHFVCVSPIVVTQMFTRD